MACMCEGTMHSKELAKQYLESIKTVKQVDSIRTRSTSKGRGCGRGRGIAKTNIGHSLKVNLDQAQTVPIVAVAIPPNDVRLLAKECYYCHKKATFHNTAGLNSGEGHPLNLGTMLDNHVVMSMT